MTNEETTMDEASIKTKVRVKSMLPKTAANFFKHKKGLFLNPLKGHPYDHQEEAFARSLHILQTYGDVIPLKVTRDKKLNQSS